MSQYPFLSVHKALETTFDTLAACGVKCPAYGVPTSASTASEKASMFDRITQAIWIANAATKTLGELHYAWMLCTYACSSESRDEAIKKIASLPRLGRNQSLVNALVEREFIYGETYCPDIREVARRVGAAETTGIDVAKRVQKAVEALRRETVDMLRPVFQAQGWLPPQREATKK